MESTPQSEKQAIAAELSAPSRRIYLADVQTAAVAALIFLLPLSSKFLVFLNEHNTNLTFPLLSSTFLTPTDLLLVAIAVLSIPTFRKIQRRSNAAMIGATGLALAIVLGVVVHPSIDGTVMLIRVIGIVGVVYLAVSLDQISYRRAFVWPLAISATLQSTLALAQTFVWRSGMTVEATIGAPGSPWTAGHGTFIEPYDLPAFLGLSVAVILAECARRRGNIFYWVAVAVSSAAIATTFGRTALLSAIFVALTYFVAWIWRHSPRLLLAGMSTVVPLTITGAVLSSSWLARAAETSSVQENIRWDLARRAIEIAANHPFIGVGPVQYGSFIPPTDGFIVHNVPLLVASEFGIFLAAALVAWLFVLGYRSVRSSPMAAAIFIYVVPYLLLDNLHYVLSVGLAMFAIWLAALARNIDPVDETRHESLSVSSAT